MSAWDSSRQDAAVVSPDDLLVPTAPCVPEVYPLETLHNALTLYQLEAFLARLAFVKFPTPFTSPHCPSTPVTQRLSRQRSGPVLIQAPIPGTNELQSGHLVPCSSLPQITKIIETPGSQTGPANTTPGNDLVYSQHIARSNISSQVGGFQLHHLSICQPTCFELNSDLAKHGSFTEFDSLLSSFSYQQLYPDTHLHILSNCAQSSDLSRETSNDNQAITTNLPLHVAWSVNSDSQDISDHLFHFESDSIDTHNNLAFANSQNDHWSNQLVSVLPTVPTPCATASSQSNQLLNDTNEEKKLLIESSSSVVCTLSDIAICKNDTQPTLNEPSLSLIPLHDTDLQVIDSMQQISLTHIVPSMSSCSIYDNDYKLDSS